MYSGMKEIRLFLPFLLKAFFQVSLDSLIMYTSKNNMEESERNCESSPTHILATTQTQTLIFEIQELAIHSYALWVISCLQNDTPQSD